MIWDRKFHFAIVGVIAIALSAFFSGPAFIKPKFKSAARIYPVNTYVFSDESETEQMLEVVNSNDILFKMVDAFQLYKVYKIDPEGAHSRFYMQDEYRSNVSASKTEFETVEIKVMDHDPNRASDMCDSVIYFYNRKMRELHSYKEKEMADIIKGSLDKRYSQLDSLLVKLNEVRNQYGILDYESQVPEITRGYMNALTSTRGTSSDAKKIENLYNNLADVGTKAIWLESRYSFLINAIDSLETEYEFYKTEYEKDITYAHVVEKPFPADKKSFPVRWLIVAFTLLSSLFIALLVFLVLDYRKRN